MEPADNDKDNDNPSDWHNSSHHISDTHMTSKGDDDDCNSETATLVPPYWSHRRHESYGSVGNTKPTPITLEDHTGEQFPESHSAWARGVTIDDYVLVAGSVPNVGNFIVWNCRIETIDVSTIVA